MSKLKVCFVRSLEIDTPEKTDDGYKRRLVVTDKNDEELILEFRGNTKADVLVKGLNRC